MATISVLDSAGAAQLLQTPNGNGQAVMASSRPVVIASDQSAIPVTGAFYPGTQPVSGVFYQATQPVSMAAVPVGAALDATIVSSNTKLDQLHTDLIAATPAGTNLIGKTGIDQTTPGTTNRVAPAALYTSGTYGTLSTGAYAVPNLDQYGNLRAVTTLQSAAGQDTVPNNALGYWGNSAIAGNGGLPAITVPHTYNGASWDRQRGDTNGTVNQPHAMASSRWMYATPTGGIVNSTSAVTIVNAAGVGVRNYLTSLQIDFDALITASEFAVRDDAGGTVLFRAKLPAGAAGSRTYNFPAPLKGTANKLMEVVTLTATGAAVGVFPCAQGFQGT